MQLSQKKKTRSVSRKGWWQSAYEKREAVPTRQCRIVVALEEQVSISKLAIILPCLLDSLMCKQENVARHHL